MTENFADLARNINLQDQEVKQMRSRIILKKSLPRYIKIKLLKTKNNIYMYFREKQYLTYRE